jgi:hypothetical protein
MAETLIGVVSHGGVIFLETDEQGLQIFLLQV